MASEQSPQEASLGGDARETMHVVKALMGVAASTDAVVAQVLVEFGVTHSAAAMLWALDPLSDPLTMREIADRIGCDPSTISLTASKLEQGGLIARRPHPKDGRKRVLVLTEQGEDLWKELSSRLHAVSPLARLTGEERRELRGLLVRMRPAAV